MINDLLAADPSSWQDVAAIGLAVALLPLILISGARLLHGWPPLVRVSTVTEAPSCDHERDDPVLVQSAEAADQPGTAWLHTLGYAATALEASADNGDQYAAAEIRAHIAAATKTRP